MFNIKKSLKIAAVLLGLLMITISWAASSSVMSLPKPTFNCATTNPNNYQSAFMAYLNQMPKVQDPFYIGGILGYGNTNWSQMVSQDGASSNATPISAGGSGVAGGVFAGYELNPYFAVEGNYMYFPSANIQFTPGNTTYGTDAFTSHTNEYTVMAKFMLPLPNSKFRVFSEIGPAYVQRHDDLADKGHIGGGFGVGVDYLMSQHWFAEAGFQYYTGYGVSELRPVYDYIPFLYTVNVRLAYRFALF